MQEFRAKPFSELTQGDIAGLQGLLPPEAVKGIKDAFDSMRSDERRSRAGQLGEMASVALSGKPDAVDAWFAPRIDAEQDPARRKALETWRESAKINPQALAKTLVTQLSLSDEGREVAKNLIEMYGLKPTEAFQTLDAAAVEKQFGIPNVPPGLYRLNTETQKLESVGGGGTTVNIKNEGPIAQDYRRVRDAQGNILYDEPIPGTRAAREAEQAIKAAESRASGQVRTASTVTQSIDSLLSDLKKEKEAKGTEKISPYTRITGVTGKAFEGYPGGARQTAKGYIDTIRANIGFDRLDQMRQESPTGGALGQIAVQEIQFLQASLGSLDLDADPDVLIKNLERIKTAYDNVMRKAAAYPNAAKYGFGTGAEPAAGGAAATPPGAGQRPSLESIFSR